MNKTVFSITKMDCPAEESLVRLSLQDVSSVKHLDFDLSDRTVAVFHHDDLESIKGAISGLNLGDSLLESIEIENIEFDTDDRQRRVLWAVLAINLVFFLIEMAFGLISSSMGLVADSLDMLADSFVYGLSLFAVGAATARKKGVAKIAGYFQIALAVAGFVEVVRRFLGVDELPEFRTMIGVSILALIANALCLYLLQRSKSKDAHIQASSICTSNDVIINFGVIVAGVLVYLSQSNKPDLIIGTVVFVVVIRGALKILRLAN